MKPSQATSLDEAVVKESRFNVTDEESDVSDSVSLNDGVNNNHNRQHSYVSHGSIDESLLQLHPSN